MVNATPLGMQAGDPAPFDTALFQPGQRAFDVVYGHGETAFVAGARAAGCTVSDGAGTVSYTHLDVYKRQGLLRQAAMSFRMRGLPRRGGAGRSAR